MSRYLTGLTVWGIACAAAAAPAINSSSGVFEHGQIISLTGTGFGSKPQAAPFLWDTFESGSYQPQWSSTVGSIGTAQPRNARSLRNNHFDFVGHLSGNTGHMTTSSGTLSRTWYVSYWTFLAPNWTWGNCSTPGVGNLSNIKIWRMWAPSDPGDESAIVNMDSGPCIGTGSRWFALGSNLHYMSFDPTTEISLGAWHLWEWEFTDSSASHVRDGALRMWFDGRPLIDATGVEFMGNYSGFKRPIDVGFWNSWGDSTTDSNDYYQDDTYVDTSLARVMLCPQGSWTARGACEVQPPVAWSSSSIRFTLNQGSLSGGSAAYLFVVDAAGAVSPAYAVTLGASTGGTGGGAGGGGGGGAGGGGTGSGGGTATGGGTGIDGGSGSGGGIGAGGGLVADGGCGRKRCRGKWTLTVAAQSGLDAEQATDELPSLDPVEGELGCGCASAGPGFALLGLVTWRRRSRRQAP